MAAAFTNEALGWIGEQDTLLGLSQGIRTAGDHRERSAASSPRDASLDRAGTCQSRSGARQHGIDAEARRLKGKESPLRQPVSADR